MVTGILFGFRKYTFSSLGFYITKDASPLDTGRQIPKCSYRQFLLADDYQVVQAFHDLVCKLGRNSVATGMQPAKKLFFLFFFSRLAMGGNKEYNTIY